MATVAFDTLAYVKRLRSAGFTEEQAEVQAEALSAALGEQLVTKQYLDMKLEHLETKLDAKIDSLELRLTVKLGAFIAIAVGIVTALLKLK
jgi:hypothetical protein